MRHHILLSLCLAPLASLHAADFKLAAVFSDHMVLQRAKPVPVWGWAEAGEKVTVEFAGQKKTATADATGKWMAKLDALQANAEPQVLKVSSDKDHKAEAQDVLVGEVWLGSGQSNMAMTVNRAKNYEQEKAAANLPLIRSFRENSPGAATAQANATGKWDVCSADTVGLFSATLYFMGREIHRELKVPVGLINSSVGGTPIESWIDAAEQAKVPELKVAPEAPAKKPTPEQEAKAKADFEAATAAWRKAALAAKKAGQPLPRKPLDPAGVRERKSGIGNLFNGKIAPLIPYAIRGVIWYQGEANSRSPKGILYQHQLPLLVKDWRARWGEELPFAWVQLPNYARAAEDWCLVRDAELKTLSLPHTGMAITVDIGEKDNIHPANKQDVGKRLSFWALGEVYDKNVLSTCGPLPAGHEIKGAEVVVNFKHADRGLKAKGGDVKGFMLAGEDKQWKPATAKIEGDKVTVTSAEVAKPVALRYAWTQYPDCNLYNGAGIPASPFRTDDWAIESPPAPVRKARK